MAFELLEKTYICGWAYEHKIKYLKWARFDANCMLKSKKNSSVYKAHLNILKWDLEKVKMCNSILRKVHEI